jgi:hypothetical protein
MVNSTRFVSDSSTLKQMTLHRTAIEQRRNKNKAHEQGLPQAQWNKTK